MGVLLLEPNLDLTPRESRPGEPMSSPLTPINAPPAGIRASLSAGNRHIFAGAGCAEQPTDPADSSPADGARGGSSDGQSRALIMLRSRVQVPPASHLKPYTLGFPRKVDTVNLLPWWLSASARSR